jgi:hypothetical protein
VIVAAIMAGLALQGAWSFFNNPCKSCVSRRRSDCGAPFFAARLLPKFGSLSTGSAARTGPKGSYSFAIDN